MEKTKHRILPLVGSIVGALFAVVVLGLVLLDGALDLQVPFFPPGAGQGTEKALDWKDSGNLVQTGNRCGAHASMAILLSSKGIQWDPNLIYDKIPEKFADGYIWPWGITRFLRSQGLESKVFLLNFLGREDRIRWITQRLGENKPVAVVIGNRKYLHYVTVLGYHGQFFDIYDSNMLTDANGPRPGNRTMEIKDLMDWMDSAEVLGVRVQVVVLPK